MKKLILTSFMLLVASVALSSHAEIATVTVGDLKYSVDTESAEASCTGLAKSGTAVTDLTIDESVAYNGVDYPVTSIAEKAFSSESKIAGTLIIPNAIKTIGDNAFYTCRNITKVNIPRSVTTIGNSVFGFCSALKSVEIEDSENGLALGSSIFSFCQLESVYLGRNLILSGEGSVASTGPFIDQQNLKSLEIGNCVTAINDYCFYNCFKLESITIPSSVTSIGENAFHSCKEVSELTLPASITSIASSAFYNCYGLKSVIIEDSESSLSIETGIFSSCNQIESVYLGRNIEYTGEGSSVNHAPFNDLKNLTSLVISNNVTSINDYMFDGCSALQSLTVPNSITSIGKDAFNGCKKLSALSIPASVTSIAGTAFGYCSGLKTVVIEDSENSLSVEASIFSFSSYIESVYLGRNITYSGGDSSLVTAPFSSQSELTSLEIGNYVTEIGEYAFYGCSSLQNITIPNSVTSIGNKAFYSCTGLKEIRIPDSVNSIGESAFYTFYGTIESVYYSATDPLEFDKKVFDSDSYKRATLYVPEKAVEKAKTIDPWMQFKNIQSHNFSGIINAEQITLNISEAEICVDETLKLVATIEPENTTDPTVVWTSSDEAIATVAEDGTVTAIAIGTATITATCGEATAACKVTVNPVTASAITLNVEDMTLLVGASDKLTVTIEPENVTDKTIVWTSSDEKVATVAEDGTVTAVAVGTATITATCGEATATCKVTVNPIEAETVTLDCEEAALTVGETLQLTATVEPEETTDKTVAWSSSDEAVVTVDETGLVTAIAAGTATVTATCGTATASCTITVIEPSGIESIIADGDGRIEVYTLNGIRVNATTPADLRTLRPGFYIINGKKTYLNPNAN